MDGEVCDKEVGLFVEIVNGDILNVVGAVKMVPNWDDDEFSQVEVG